MAEVLCNITKFWIQKQMEENEQNNLRAIVSQKSFEYCMSASKNYCD